MTINLPKNNDPNLNPYFNRIYFFNSLQKTIPCG